MESSFPSFGVTCCDPVSNFSSFFVFGTSFFAVCPVSSSASALLSLFLFDVCVLPFIFRVIFFNLPGPPYTVELPWRPLLRRTALCAMWGPLYRCSRRNTLQGGNLLEVVRAAPHNQRQRHPRQGHRGKRDKGGGPEK
eukprot:GHVT01029845.1.p1 GENE.GHVT01029845.1~~GHVT01029845.1.p1  ORF type:complete len:138 (-),score=21.47 GHVT01029845.1:1942-2355(-)